MENSITVRYIQKLPVFNGLSLVAGKSGLDNVITNCTILDYEYEKTVVNKFTHINFVEGDFILTSFLYAKDNEFLIMDAVKRLSKSGCSGLAIRNVFRLQISSNVIHYADAEGFPIFIMKDVSISFEAFIFTIKSLVQRNQSVDWAERYVDKLLQKNLGSQEVIETALQMNPSFETEFCVCYFKWKEALTFDDVQMVFERLQPQLRNSDCLFYYKNGVMLIHTIDIFDLGNEEGAVQYYNDALGDLREAYCTGVSQIHHLLSEMDQAIEESLYAAVYSAWTKAEYTSYATLGVYWLILPHMYEHQYENFCKKYITLLRDFDYENNTKLFATAEQYVLADGDVAVAANALSQHKNTIRCRLNKISEICHTDVAKKSGYAQLFLAFKIYFARIMISGDSRLFRSQCLAQGEDVLLPGRKEVIESREYVEGVRAENILSRAHGKEAGTKAAANAQEKTE